MHAGEARLANLPARAKARKRLKAIVVAPTPTFRSQWTSNRQWRLRRRLDCIISHCTIGRTKRNEQIQ